MMDDLLPRAQETPNEYAQRVRSWYLAQPSTASNTPGFRQTEWEYIASLCGIDPGPPIAGSKK